MCLPSPKVPAPPPPPAQRQAMKAPEHKSFDYGDPMKRRRGYMALMGGSRASLQAPPTTTGTLGG